MRTSRTKSLLLNAATLVLASVLLLAVVSADAAPAAPADAQTPAPFDRKKKKLARQNKGAAKKAPVIASAKAASVHAAPAPTKNAATKAAPTPQNLTAKTLAQARLNAAKKIAPTMKPTVAAIPAVEDDKRDFAPSLQASVNAPAAPRKRWSILANIQRSHNIYEQETGTRKELDDFLTDLSYSVTDNFKLLTEITWERDTQTGESDFGDTILQVSRKGYGITKSLTLGPKIYYVAPTSKASQQQESHGAAGAGLTLGFAEGVLPANLVIMTDVTLTAFMQEYQTTEDGKILSQYSSRQRLLFEYDFSVFEISGALYHKSGQNYAGTISEAYGHAEEIGYKPTEYLTLAIGHSLDGSVMKPNTVDTNIYFVNKADSMYYGSLALSF